MRIIINGRRGIDCYRFYWRSSRPGDRYPVRVRHPDCPPTHFQPVLDDPQAVHRSVRADPDSRRLGHRPKAFILRLPRRPRCPFHAGQAGQPQSQED